MTGRQLGLPLLFAATFVLFAIVMLAGCTAAVPVPPAQSTTQAWTPPPAPGPIPTGIRIPTIGVSSTLAPTGVLADGRLQTPPVETPMQAAWFVGSPEPGEPGPAIVLGHVNGAGRPGVFARLHQLKPGAAIVIDRQGAAPARFVVTKVERHPKTSFPTTRVYGDTHLPTLRLITCGGAFDPAAHSYEDNIIAWAELQKETTHAAG